MSSIASLGAASAALPQLNVHHGHKKGAPELSTDLLSSQNSAQVPVPAVQNQFGNLLRSLEQAIGLGSSPATASTAAAAAPTSAATLNTLQNYLHNAPQSVQAGAAKVSLNA